MQVHTGTPENRHLKFIMFRGTHYIDDFNVKSKAAVLQQKQDWEVLQIKDMVTPEHYGLCYIGTLWLLIFFNCAWYTRRPSMAMDYVEWTYQVNLIPWHIRNVFDTSPPPNSWSWATLKPVSLNATFWLRSSFCSNAFGVSRIRQKSSSLGF